MACVNTGHLGRFPVAVLPRMAVPSPGQWSPPQDGRALPKMAAPSPCSVFGMEAEATFVTAGASHTGTCTRKPRRAGDTQLGALGLPRIRTGQPAPWTAGTPALQVLAHITEPSSSPHPELRGQCRLGRSCRDGRRLPPRSLPCTHRGCKGIGRELQPC